MQKYFLAALGILLLLGCNGDSGSGPPDVFTANISATFETSANSVTIDQIEVAFDNTILLTKTCNASEVRLCNITTTVSAPRGNHTVSLRLIRQFCNLLPCSTKQPYTVDGNVSVSDATGIVQQIPLLKRAFTLGDGDVIAYQITVNP
jgi:type 1 fimbria pilin